MCCASLRQTAIFSHRFVVRTCRRQKLTLAVLALVFGMLAAHACARVLTLSHAALLTELQHCAKSAVGDLLCGHHTLPSPGQTSRERSRGC